MVASTKDHRGAVNAIMVAPRTGGEAISAGSDGCCIIWDLSGGGAKRRASFQSNTFFKSVAYHPDESQVRRPPQLACVGGAPRARPGVMWWRCHRWTAPAGGGEGRPEGSVRVLWAWTHGRGSARWHAACGSGRVVRRRGGALRRRASCVQAVTTGTDRKITYWDVYDGSAVRVVDASEDAAMCDVAVDAAGDVIVSGGAHKLVQVPPPRGPCALRASSPHAHTLARCGGRRGWPVVEPRKVTRIMAHTRPAV